MREKELRLALICYGGISLAVYMHGIGIELWRLARASRNYHAGETDVAGCEAVYVDLLSQIEAETGLRLRVLIDIIAGASAGGINGIFLGHAIASGRSPEPLTDLWLRAADVDVLIDPDARPLSRFSKFWAAPLAWIASGKADEADEAALEPGTRGEVRAKLARFVRARWFAPPFGGEGFTALLLDAFDAMEAGPAGPALLPEGQPLDLFVTVTDFHGHPERLRLHLPDEAVEIEHRLTIGFSDGAAAPRHLAEIPELVFAARATASFPGAFPPFTVAELDRVLAARDCRWPGREAFLKRILPRQYAIGTAEQTVLIDGSVLANAPFRPAIEALADRPARREIDRRFVYIDPKPGVRSLRINRRGGEVPGFFATIFGALSDIPREQPIRDNLEAIEQRSSRVRRMQRIVEATRPEVEAAIATLFGRTLFLDSPTAQRLAGWRRKANEAAARQAGFAYAGYGHLKLSGIVEGTARLMHELAGDAEGASPGAIRAGLWRTVRESGLSAPGAMSSAGASEPVIAFFRAHDVDFRTRRLRFTLRQLAEIEHGDTVAPTVAQDTRDAIYRCLARYLDRQIDDHFGADVRAAAARAGDEPAAALASLAEARDLRIVDDATDEELATAFAALPKSARRAMLLAYLGFAFYDIATLSLLQGDGYDEFNAVKVDRISPDDATAIRAGGAAAVLKGVRFNSFGAFFSRAYRENDYLWGRLHGADRLIDIVVSTLPEGKNLPPGRITLLKQRAFRAILQEERPRLTTIAALIDALEREVG